MNNKYVVYYRLSLMKEEGTGLGLDAQRAMFSRFLLSRPGEVLSDYTEIETGKTLKKSLNRPELTKAIAHARSAEAILVIPRLDRLARNVAFTSALLESKLRIICCDMPEADTFTLHIMSAVAQREGELISERTSAALQVLKERGVLLGSARPGHWEGFTKKGESMAARRNIGLQRAREASKKTNQEKMTIYYEPLIPWIRELRQSGNTLYQIVDALNCKGCLTTRGKVWNIATLHRVIAKYLGSDYLGQLTSKLRPCVAAKIL